MSDDAHPVTFENSDHRLAGALPRTQPDEDPLGAHRLAGALPARQPAPSPVTRDDA